MTTMIGKLDSEILTWQTTGADYTPPQVGVTDIAVLSEPEVIPSLVTEANFFGRVTGSRSSGQNFDIEEISSNGVSIAESGDGYLISFETPGVYKIEVQGTMRIISASSAVYARIALGRLSTTLADNLQLRFSTDENHPVSIGTSCLFNATSALLGPQIWVRTTQAGGVNSVPDNMFITVEKILNTPVRDEPRYSLDLEFESETEFNIASLPTAGGTIRKIVREKREEDYIYMLRNIAGSTYLTMFINGSVYYTLTVNSDPNPRGFYFRRDLMRFWVADNNTDQIKQYDTPFPGYVTSATLTATEAVSANPQGITFTRDGMRLIECASNIIYFYDLVSPWQVSGMTLHSSVTLTQSDLGDLEYNADGSSLFVVNVVSKTVYEHPCVNYVPQTTHTNSITLPDEYNDIIGIDWIDNGRKLEVCTRGGTPNGFQGGKLKTYRVLGP
jgi:hypothetical protein